MAICFQSVDRWRSLQRCMRLSFRKCSSQQSKSLKLMFLGSDEFALEHLKALHGAKCIGLTAHHQKLHQIVNNVAVKHTDVSFDKITDIDVISLGSNSPVRSFARKHSLQTLNWPELLERATEQQHKHVKYDLGVVASFGKLIPEKVIQLARFGMLNVHPSLLPRWRGAAPIVHTIAHGDVQTGVSIMKIAPRRFDIGDVLLRQSVTVAANASTVSLREQLAQLGSCLLLQTLVNLNDYLRKATPQSQLQTTNAQVDGNILPIARKVQPAMFRIDWNAVSLQQLDRLWRALSSIEDLRTAYRGLPVRLIKLMPVEQALNIARSERERSTLLAGEKHWPPGTVRFSRQSDVLLILCGDRQWAACSQLVFKKPQSATDFANGFISKTPEKMLVFESLSGNPFLDQTASYSSTSVNAAPGNAKSVGQVRLT